MENTALSRTNGKLETGMDRVKNYILSPEVKARFTEMMGRNAMYYLNQVLIVVSGSDALQKCSPKSILIAAMRAASLRLSVDSVKGQAWIIPYNGEASFQLGYKGVYELAMRTNQYRVINVFAIYEGEIIAEDRMSGMHSIHGRRASDTVIAWMLYFELRNGFKKTFYMTVEQIEAHAKHYSQSWKNPKSKWHDPVERPKMESKTVLSNGLRKWGRFNEADMEIIEAIEEAQGWQEPLPEENEVTVQVIEHTESSILGDLGFADPAPAPAKPAVVPATPSQPAVGAPTTTTGDTHRPTTPEPAVAPGEERSPYNMTRATANTAKTKEGEFYKDIPTDKLTFRLNTMLKNPQPDEETKFKIDAIRSIFYFRDLDAKVQGN